MRFGQVFWLGHHRPAPPSQFPSGILARAPPIQRRVRTGLSPVSFFSRPHVCARAPKTRFGFLLTSYHSDLRSSNTVPFSPPAHRFFISSLFCNRRPVNPALRDLVPLPTPTLAIAITRCDGTRRSLARARQCRRRILSIQYGAKGASIVTPLPAPVCCPSTCKKTAHVRRFSAALCAVFLKFAENIPAKAL